MAISPSSFNISNLQVSNEISLGRSLCSCNFVFGRRVLGYSQFKASPRIVVNSGSWRREKDAIIVNAYRVSSSDDNWVLDDDTVPKPDDGGSGDGNAGLPPENDGNGGGGGGDGDDEGGDEDEKEFGPIMGLEEVIKETEKMGATLPSDILEAAKTTGIRKLLLTRYLDLQGSVWPLGFLMRHFPMFRNRMLADPAFLFKIGTECL